MGLVILLSPLLHPHSSRPKSRLLSHVDSGWKFSKGMPQCHFRVLKGKVEALGEKFFRCCPGAREYRVSCHFASQNFHYFWGDIDIDFGCPDSSKHFHKITVFYKGG